MLRRFRLSLSASACLVLMLCWLAAGCGGGNGDEGSSSPAASGGGGGGGGGGGTGGGGGKQAAKTDAGDSAPAAKAEGWGTLTGRITLAGDIPQLPPLVEQGNKEVKDAEHCAMDDVPNERLVVDPDTKGIRDVFVYLRRKPDQIHPELEEPDQKEVDFDQKDCRFLNHAMAVRLDQTLLLKNSDPIAHNTNIIGRQAGAKNALLAPNAEPDPFSFARSLPLPAPVECNIHSWMKAWILPLDHPYVAVTNEKGEFTIENLPAGIELEFRVWQEVAGYVNSADGSITKGNLSVTLEADGTTTKDIEIDVSKLDLN